MRNKRVKNIHFIGIGGIGMSGIAEVIINMGFHVSGSDLKSSNITERLKSLGVDIRYGHREGNVGGADVVVYSSAVKRDNPEIMAAHEAHIPVIPRAEMLAELMKMKYGIAVAGTHGKTTTTSMIATVLYHGGKDPTVVIGGRLNSIGSNAKLGKGDYLLAEADESDGSFLKLSPTVAIVTNIDPEHMEQYQHDIEEVKSAYLNFINSVPFYGFAVINLDHPNLQGLLPLIERAHLTYGKSAQADFRASNLERKGRHTSFDVTLHNKKLGKVNLPMPGEHNVYNALATIAVGIELGVDFKDIKDALEGFSGVGRRFEIKAISEGIVVVDDYGHHPVEIRMTLRAAKEGWGKRTVVVFQPHRYSRTKELYQDFLSAFYDADKLILTDIYPAGEKPVEGVDALSLYEGIKGFGHKDVLYIKSREEVVEHLISVAVPDDMVITLGAGDVGKIGEDFIDRLKGFKDIGNR